MAETDSESKTKDDVYRERNLLALAFIQSQTSWNNLQGRREPDCGWWPDTDDVNDSEWAVVWINLHDDPDQQVGWHVPREIVPEWLTKRDPDYDGYTTDEKNRRVAEYAGIESP